MPPQKNLAESCLKKLNSKQTTKIRSMIWKHSTPTKALLVSKKIRGLLQTDAPANLAGKYIPQRQSKACAHEAADERLLYVSISELAKRPHIAWVTLLGGKGLPGA